MKVLFVCKANVGRSKMADHPYRNRLVIVAAGILSAIAYLSYYKGLQEGVVSHLLSLE